jgi:hypothetical protein
MLATLSLAALNLVISISWISSNLGDKLTDAQHRWYVELPLLFCVVPIASIILSLIASGKIRRSTLFHFVLQTSLVINLVGFFIYFAQSGGGL